MIELSPHERIILAIDTSSEERAAELAGIAREAGARFIKMGLELESATSWRFCSELAAEYELDWVADAKLDDIPNTVAKTAGNISRQAHPPFGITMHTTAGIEAMRAAQEAAGDDVMMMGVTVLTSITDMPEGGGQPGEAQRIYRVHAAQKVMELAHDAARAGLRGIVASPKEVGMIKRNHETGHLFAMIPGIRPTGAEAHDQSRPATPAEAVRDGADLLVIGRPITEAEKPIAAYKEVIEEIEGAL